MERLFIYVFLGLVLFASVLFLILRRFVTEETQERNFTPGNANDDTGYVESAPREVAAYEERQSSIIAAGLRKAPKTIATAVFIQLFLMMFTGYLSVQNIERIAMSGAAITQGDYGMAISALWPIGKDAGVEQYRVSRGVHPFLDESNLTGFAYIGKLEGKNVAVMDHLYSTQHHDEELTEKDEAYGNVIKGLTASEARNVCQDKYPNHNTDLISFAEWELSRNHFLAARNVKPFLEIPEWARDISKDDNDDYYVIAKDSGVRKLAKKNDLDGEEDWLYIDEDELSSNGFRCSITWE